MSIPHGDSMFHMVSFGAENDEKKVNSSRPRRCGCNLKLTIFKPISRTDMLSIACKIALRWMLQDSLMICQYWFRKWLSAIRHYFLIIIMGIPILVNSLAPGKCEWNFRYLVLQIISMIDGWGISCELALRWMSLDLTDEKSTLVQVMAWCRQATSHYLNQCWVRSQTASLYWISPQDIDL